MEIKTLEQLQEADMVTLGFTLAGLGRMAPNDARRRSENLLSQIASESGLLQVWRHRPQTLPPRQHPPAGCDGFVSAVLDDSP
ncbi:hypothetical protein AB0F43_31485 [Kribbella sp. NPDC023972]|uniref:hypothetical protein n=1 Tax=Kribbella sp. NPDC023972 TaxID=3154795 RepID=UPI003404395D